MLLRIRLYQIVYIGNYLIECNDKNSINYGNASFPIGKNLYKRPFFYINIFWTIMPLYIILYLLNNYDLETMLHFHDLKSKL